MEQGYRERFKGSMPNKEKTPSQSMVRISNSFTKWVKLAGADKSSKGVGVRVDGAKAVYPLISKRFV